MGEPLEVEVLLDSNMVQLKALIERKKKISSHRFLLRDKNMNVPSVTQEKNTFRRLNLSDGYVFTIEPYLSETWLWHEPQWYIDKLIEDIKDVIKADVTKQAPVIRIAEKVIVPMHLRNTSLRVFIRQYPEHFYVNVDTNLSRYWVGIVNKKASTQLSTYSDFPCDVGKIVHHKTMPFDWDAHADINDTKRVELDFEIPDMEYEISIISAADVMRADTFGSSDPFCVVTFYNGVENKRLGQTNTKRNTLNPVWTDQRFTLSINASYEVESTILLVEMWDCDIGPHGQSLQGDFLGAVELTGLDICELIADGETHILEYDLQQREESSPEEDQSGVKGKLKIKGGKAGYEVRLVNCRSLILPQNKYSKPFGILLFNGDELDSTLPEQRNIRDPVYETTVNLSFSEMTMKLRDCELEFQIWCTVGKGEGIEDEEAKGTFMGALSITGDDLENFLRGNLPYANSVRKKLGQTKNVPLKQRKNPVEGFITVIGGPAGLPMQPGKKIEIILKWGDRLAKVVKTYIDVEWNFVRVGCTPKCSVVLAQCTWDTAFQIETTAGSENCLTSDLRLDLWEDEDTAVGVMGQTYLGCIQLSAEELSELCDGKYAKEVQYDWQLDPNKEGKLQRMVRGNVSIRAGTPKARKKNERILIVYACKNLGRANTGAMLGLGSSDPYVVVTFNGTVIGKTTTLEANLNPLWDEPSWFIEIPPLRTMEDKELKEWVTNNEKLKAEGKPAIERTMYHEYELQVAVYDETDGGGEGSCLGVVILQENDLMKFFEAKEAHADWLPLTKDIRPENKDKKTKNPTLGTDSEIKIGTPAKQYPSQVAWKEAVEAEIEAENERLRLIEEERLAAEAQEAEREYQKLLAEQEAAAREQEAILKAEELARAGAEVAAENADEEASLAQSQAAIDEEEAAAAEIEAKRKADAEAYEDMMLMADDDED